MRIVFHLWRGLVIAALSTLLFVYGCGLVTTSGPLPDNVRCDAANVARIPSEPVYRFAVLGDPEDGLDQFARILDRMKERPPAFVVILGDVIHYATEWAYLYFLHRFRGMDFPRPVFPGIGNHDISWWRITERGRYQYFRKYFGPENFWFRHEGSLFLMIDNAEGGITKKAHEWATRVLEEHAKSSKHIFMFCHVPIVRYTHEGTVEEPPGEVQDGKFYELVIKYGVRIVCTAHLHSYRRTVFPNGTVHLVSGAGGGTHQGADVFDHYVEIEVDGDRVNERIVKVEPLGWLGAAKQDIHKVAVRDVFLRLRCQPQWEMAILAACVIALLTLRLRAFQRR